MNRCVLIIFFSIAMLAANAQEVTYTRDIAPLIMEKCARCHQPGEAAPFSLLTYEDVSKRASFIKKVIQSRYMPPWHADAQYSHFANDRSLSDKEIALLSKWIDDKAPKGSETGKPAMKPVVAGTLFN